MKLYDFRDKTSPNMDLVPNLIALGIMFAVVFGSIVGTIYILRMINL